MTKSSSESYRTRFESGLLIARSQPRTRFSVASGQTWLEYRLRRLNPAEYDELYRAGVVYSGNLGSRCVLEERRTQTDGDAVDVGSWTVWQIGHKPDKLIWETLGDTQFLNAESLHAGHSKPVAAMQLRLAARAVIQTYIKDLSAAVDAAGQLIYEANSCWSAAQNKYEGCPTKLARAEKRLLAKYQTKVEAAKQRQDDAQRIFEEADAAYRQLKKPAVLTPAWNRYYDD